MLRQVSQQLHCKTQLIFFFFHYTVNLVLPLSSSYLIKPPWNCVSTSQICRSGCCSLSWSLSIWLYVKNFNLQIPHDHTCRCSLKIQFRSLKLHFRSSRSSPDNFPFVNLVLSKPKQICMKNCKENNKRTTYRDVNVNKAG